LRKGRRPKTLTKNWVKIDLAFEDIKRILDSNMEREDKVRRIQEVLDALWVSK